MCGRRWAPPGRERGSDFSRLERTRMSIYPLQTHQRAEGFSSLVGSVLGKVEADDASAPDRIVPGGCSIDSVQRMDPSRKRRIRLVVALTAAVVLAGALAYTSFSASSPAVQPSKLLASANSGRSYQLTGKVVDGSIEKRGDATLFRVPGPQRSRLCPRALRGGGARSLPQRARGHRHGAQARQRVRGREGLAGDEVPVEVHRQAGVADLISWPL